MSFPQLRLTFNFKFSMTVLTSEIAGESAELMRLTNTHQHTLLD